MSNRLSSLVATSGKPLKDIPLLSGTVGAPRATQPEYFWASANGHAQSRVRFVHESESGAHK